MRHSLASLIVAALCSCSKADAPAPAPASSASAAPRAAEPAATFDPSMPSFKCGSIKCNVDYYCVERRRGEPPEVCTMHPPSPKRQGCSKVADRSYVCETF